MHLSLPPISPWVHLHYRCVCYYNWLYVGLGDPSVGPHVCMTRGLPTELSSQFLQELFLVCLTVVLKVIVCCIQLEIQQVLRHASVQILHSVHQGVDKGQELQAMRASEMAQHVRALT